MDGSEPNIDHTCATHHDNSTDRGNDDEDAEEEELVSEEDQQWDAFLTEKRDKGEIKSCEGLECFLNGKERWKAANEKLDRALQTYTNKTNNSMQAVLHDLVKQIQASSNRDANEVSDDCKAHLVGGHRRRETCLKKLQQADRKSKVTFKTLVARTLDEEQPASEENREGIVEVSLVHWFLPKWFVIFTSIFTLFPLRLRCFRSRKTSKVMDPMAKKNPRPSFGKILRMIQT